MVIIISGIYSFLKAVLAHVFIAVAEPKKYWEQVWMILLIPLSLLQLLYYWRVWKFAKSK